MHTQALRCWRPAQDCAAEFASLPYDVFDKESARAYVAAHPLSFLSIDRGETAFPAEHNMYADDVYQKAAELLEQRKSDGTLVCDDTPCYYLYMLEQPSDSQTEQTPQHEQSEPQPHNTRQNQHAHIQRQIGIVCEVAVDDYQKGIIRRHETTRRDKELDRVRHIQATQAQTGPIFLAYRDNDSLDALVLRLTQSEPLYDFSDDWGIHQKVWRISDPRSVKALHDKLEELPCSYIADGHHRAASAVRVCLAKREEQNLLHQADKAASYEHFLAVLFPAHQLNVLAYNRVVLDRAGLGLDELLSGIRNAGFEIYESQTAVEPAQRGCFGMYTQNRWWRLCYNANLPQDVVSALDVSRLQERILQPLLKIDNPRENPRIRFVGGIEGTDVLERMAGSDGVSFSLYPTSIDELMEVSDAGRLMPPKSTWFEPKLRSGLFIRSL